MRYLILLISFSLFFPVLAQKSRSEYLSYTSYIQSEREDRITRIDSVVLQINERMGEHDSEIGIVYSKGDKVDIGYAWIEDMNGNIIRKLKKNEITDRSYISDITLYQDDFIKTFHLKHNIYPYKVVYSIKFTSKYPQIIDVDDTQRQIPLRSRKIIVETPADKKIKYKQCNIDLPQIDSVGNKIVYTWQYSYEPEKKQAWSPTNRKTAPLLKVVPIDFTYGKKGSYRDWISYGDWVCNLNEGRDELTEEEKVRITRLLDGIVYEKEKVKVLYHYLQDNTRYINISIKTGGFQTYPASYVCMNKYGDCKALTNYMQAMLKFVGIKSFYTLINAGDERADIDVGFPSQEFNHVILTVPLEKDTVYIECTSKNLPFGYLGTFIQGRKALLIERGKSRFTTTSLLNCKNVLCRDKYEIKISTDNAADVILQATERGENFERSNSLINTTNKSFVDKFINNYILSGSFDLQEYKFSKPHRDSDSLTMDIRFRVHDIYKEYGNNILLKSFPIINLPRFESPEDRTQDIQIDYPICQIASFVYIFDTNKTIDKVPDNLEFRSVWGDVYSVEYIKDGNKLYIEKKINISARIISKDEYADFYYFMNKVVANESKNIYTEIL